MTNYKGYCAKANMIRNDLNAIPTKGNETLSKVIEIITEKVDFYEQCVLGWEQPGIENRWSTHEIEIGKKCGDAGLNMAATIVNEMRIEFGRK